MAETAVAETAAATDTVRHMNQSQGNPTVHSRHGPWQQRLAHIVETVRQMSTFTDPQEMVEYYGDRMERYFQYDGYVSLSRRGLSYPQFRVTRSSTWTREVDPWKERDRLPLLSGGMLCELLYGNEPRIVNDLSVPPDDPAAPYLAGMGSMIAVPHFDKGEGVNMICTLRKDRVAINPEEFPELVWMSNLFGRATGTLVISGQLRDAYESIERELRVVADIQRSLLPRKLPEIPGLDFATHYQTSRNAGGDYFDFFDLPGGRLGILVADVSGHGTPAAVLMAILHSIAHLAPHGGTSPSALLRFVNEQLSRRYTLESGMFVTAFHAVYDPASRRLTYSSAGHNPPRIRVGFTGPGGPVLSLDQAQGLPLGVLDEAEYVESWVEIDPGDALVFYTDGITEAFGPRGDMYGTDRLDAVLAQPHPSAAAMLTAILDDLRVFAGAVPPGDDRTMIVMTAS